MFARRRSQESNESRQLYTGEPSEVNARCRYLLETATFGTTSSGAVSSGSAPSGRTSRPVYARQADRQDGSWTRPNRNHVTWTEIRNNKTLTLKEEQAAVRSSRPCGTTFGRHAQRRRLSRGGGMLSVSEAVEGTAEERVSHAACLHSLPRSR